MNPAPPINENVLDAARYHLRAVLAWLAVQPPRPDWDARVEFQSAACRAILDVLAQPDAIPAGSEWYSHVIALESQSASDEEWYEVTHYGELCVRAREVTCEEYTNLATIIGAGQTYLVRVCSADPDSEAQRTQLARWCAGLDAALAAPRTWLHIGSRAQPA